MSRYTRALFRRLVVWAGQNSPDPLATAEQVLSFNLTDEAATEVVAKAVDEAPTWRTLEDPYVGAMLASREADLQALILLLEKYHFDEAEEAALLIAQEHDLDVIMDVARGHFPGKQSVGVIHYLAQLGLEKQYDPEHIPYDWAQLDRDCFQAHGILPHELDELTLPEISALVRADSNPLDTIVRAMTDKHAAQLTHADVIRIAKIMHR